MSSYMKELGAKHYMAKYQADALKFPLYLSKEHFFHSALVGTLSSFFLWNVTLVLSRAPVGGPDELCKGLTGGCQKKTWYGEMPFVSKRGRWWFLDSTDQLNKCSVSSPASWKAWRECQEVEPFPCLAALLFSSLHILHQVELISSLDHTLADRLMPPPPASTIHVPNHSNFLLHDYAGKQESNAWMRLILSTERTWFLIEKMIRWTVFHNFQ